MARRTKAPKPRARHTASRAARPARSRAGRTSGDSRKTRTARPKGRAKAAAATGGPAGRMRPTGRAASAKAGTSRHIGDARRRTTRPGGPVEAAAAVRRRGPENPPPGATAPRARPAEPATRPKSATASTRRAPARARTRPAATPRPAIGETRADERTRRKPERTPPVAPPVPDETAAAAHDEEPLLVAPTSFNLDLRHARAPETLEEPAEADPESAVALAAGDRDVRWEAAASVGDEAPGGDNPTPDQDVVDLIGRSLGVEYDDNEELRGAEKIAERDRHRWELDPASAEDYRERGRS